MICCEYVRCIVFEACRGRHIDAEAAQSRGKALPTYAAGLWNEARHASRLEHPKRPHLAAAAGGLEALPGVPGSGAKALPLPGDCRRSPAEPGVGGNHPAAYSTSSAAADAPALREVTWEAASVLKQSGVTVQVFAPCADGLPRVRWQ